MSNPMGGMRDVYKIELKRMFADHHVPDYVSKLMNLCVINPPPVCS